MRNLFTAFFLLFSLGWPSLSPLHAQQVDAREETQARELRAEVTSILSETRVEGIRQMVFEAKTDEGALYQIDTSQGYVEGLRYRIHRGSRVFLQVVPSEDGTSVAYLVDVDRSGSIFLIIAIFALAAVGVGFWRGFFALIGLGTTLAILFLFVFPQILAGADPVFVTVLGAVGMLAINMPLSHGFKKETLAALSATIAGLGLAVLFTYLFVWLANLSGVASEEASLLQAKSGLLAHPQGILLAAIILGAVGVLDDVTIAQSEAAIELRRANPSLSRKELFLSAMRLGRHHIASTVNTLVLAYVGSAMPLFLLFLYTHSETASFFLNTENVAEEIVRTLAGTTALILTIPLATLISVWISARPKKS